MKNTFQNENIAPAEMKRIVSKSRECRGDIITMTTLASSGHPGGAMSSIDILNVIYNYSNISPENKEDDDRDRIIVSNGHISPALYSVLGRSGFLTLKNV